MKVLARIHVWFPGIDKSIEETVQRCPGCQRIAKDPPKAFVHPWNWPTKPFDRIHIDFFGPFYGNTTYCLSIHIANGSK